MTNAKKNFSERLKACRADLGITVREMSEKTEIPVSTIETHLGGLSMPRGEMLIRYSDLFGVSAHWLLTGDFFTHVPPSIKMN